MFVSESDSTAGLLLATVVICRLLRSCDLSRAQSLPDERLTPAVIEVARLAGMASEMVVLPINPTPSCFQLCVAILSIVC